MSDYIVYHKAEKMGYPALDVDNLAIYTRKAATGAIGSRVWLIAGEGSPRKYYLRATFLIGGIGPSDKPDFINCVTGTDGQLFDPMPRIDTEPWFAAFREEQGRFAFGFNPVRNPAAERGLRTALSARSVR